ncbi:MAG: metalloregulator ArsR/SmtB family transcription factor [Patescibacteria group bacterium]|nr:metalloregulator ArsR/SmtB family transcription factor [Patescibacteria group bacterium]MDD4303965.1 metalloregulator ArsR/SmtB family transcription factor [Patescibacteria group bacterium]MDD4695046.1 metalloregulator ArsR/SmtB family transcription factor [Patescibacteria group bacterium]
MKQKCCSNKKLSKELTDLARFLRIIGDDNRLKILCLLRNKELCVCEILENLDLEQNLVSSHLKVLLDFKLITIRKDWKRNYYSINQKTFKKYNSLLTNFLKNYE